MTLLEDAEAIWRAGLAAVHAGAAVQRWLTVHGPQLDRFESVWLVGAGKAAVPMAEPVARHLGQRLAGGLLTTKDGHGWPVQGVRVLEAAHPVPDARSVAAAQRTLDLARGLGADELLLCVLSGGASSLWTAPVDGLDLATVRRRTEQLQRSAIDIEAINRERASWSLIKGGGLTRAAAPARVWTLVLSDVPGSPMSVGSGPTLGCARFDVVADHTRALDAAADAARARGYEIVRVEGSGPHGVVLDRVLAAMRPGAVVLSGGETTVRVTGSGRGGRNQHFALDAAIRLAGQSGWALCAAGTDGTDGPTGDAGGLVDGGSAGQGAQRALARFDSGSWLAEHGGLFTTGPTGTNVMDLRVLVVK